MDKTATSRVIKRVAQGMNKRAEDIKPIINIEDDHTRLIKEYGELFRRSVELQKRIAGKEPGQRLRSKLHKEKARFDDLFRRKPGIKTLQQAVDAAKEYIDDIESEATAESGDLWDKLKTRGGSYALWGAGGAGVGRLISGKKHALLGYSTGGLAGLIANYLRRKSYYGDLVSF